MEKVSLEEAFFEGFINITLKAKKKLYMRAFHFIWPTPPVKKIRALKKKINLSGKSKMEDIKQITVCLTPQ